MNFTMQYCLHVTNLGSYLSILADVRIRAVTKIETFKKKGKTYVRIKSYSLKIEPTDVHLHFSNLFNGDKVLGNYQAHLNCLYLCYVLY